jgi:hypothetical protein
MSARADLCGGRSAMVVPTATAKCQRVLASRVAYDFTSPSIRGLGECYEIFPRLASVGNRSILLLHYQPSSIPLHDDKKC